MLPGGSRRVGMRAARLPAARRVGTWLYVLTKTAGRGPKAHLFGAGLEPVAAQSESLSRGRHNGEATVHVGRWPSSASPHRHRLAHRLLALTRFLPDLLDPARGLGHGVVVEGVALAGELLDDHRGDHVSHLQQQGSEI